MKIKSLVLGTAAAAMALAPLSAVAAQEEAGESGSTGIILGVAAAVGVIAAIVIANDGEDEPVSR